MFKYHNIIFHIMPTIMISKDAYSWLKSRRKKTPDSGWAHESYGSVVDRAILASGLPEEPK